MPNSPDVTQNPNDLLASSITDALVAKGLITETHKETLLAKLKSGGVTQDDWNLWIDLATSPKTNLPEADNE